MSRGRRHGLIPLAYQDLNRWPCPDATCFDDSQQRIFGNRKSAVEMYSKDESYLSINAALGLSRSEVSRLVRRCVLIHEDGDIYGFRALISGVRVNGYSRQLAIVRQPGHGSAGCAGALGQLFDRYPEIKEMVNDLFLNRGEHSAIHESRVSYSTVHNEFKKALRELELTDLDWPFNTANCGYKSLHAYLRKVEENRGNGVALSRSGRDAMRRGRVGNGHRPLFPALRMYGAMQLDFHKIDAAAVIVLKNDFGYELEVPVSRWHIGFLVDEKSAAIVGAYISLEETPSGDSTLEIVESSFSGSAFSQDDPRFTLSTNGRSLVAQLIPELEFQCFSVLKVDNGWSNAAHEVVNNIIDTVGCAVNFGPCYAWWRRDLIEGINGALTRRGLQRLPSTHGSGAHDTRIDDPNGTAVRFRILLSELVTILYGCIKSHNTETNERLQWTPPIDAIKCALEHSASGFFHIPLPKNVQKDLKLMMHIEEVTVRGSLKKNVRPYFVLDRCRYTNESLANSFWLIGKKLITFTERRKCRNVSATVKETGESLGKMKPSGRWANSDCSWRDRKLINRSGIASRNSNIHDDPVRELINTKATALINRPRKQKKHSSAEGLKLANIVARNRSDGNVFVTNDRIAPNEPISHPKRINRFGLDTLPVISAIRKRR